MYVCVCVYIHIDRLIDIDMDIDSNMCEELRQARGQGRRCHVECMYTDVYR